MRCRQRSGRAAVEPRGMQRRPALGVPASPRAKCRTTCRRSAAKRISSRWRRCPRRRRIPGARSVKTSVDREAGDALNFQNSVKFPIHWDFLSEHRSVAAGASRRVTRCRSSTASEYYSAFAALRARRGDLLRRARHVGVRDLARTTRPTPTMIRTAYEQHREQHASSAAALFFHPTSLEVEGVAAGAAERRVPIISTDELFAGIDYQPLNLGRGDRPAALRDGAASSKTELRQLPRHRRARRVPNDISVTQGIITERVPDAALARQRAVAEPRHAQHGAARRHATIPELRALEGQVGAADGRRLRLRDRARWTRPRPTPGGRSTSRRVCRCRAWTTSITDLRDVAEIVPADVAPDQLLRDHQGRAPAPSAARPRTTPRSPTSRGCAYRRRSPFPVYYYRQFMSENGFDHAGARAARRSRRSTTTQRCATRASRQLRDAMRAAPVDAEFEALLTRQAGQPTSRASACASAPAPTPRISTASRAPASTRRSTGELARPGEPRARRGARGLGQRLVVPHVRGAQLPQHRPQRGRHGAARPPQLPRRRGQRRGAHRQPVRSRRASSRPSTSTCRCGEVSVVQPAPGTTTGVSSSTTSTCRASRSAYLSRIEPGRGRRAVLHALAGARARHGARRDPQRTSRRPTSRGGPNYVVRHGRRVQVRRRARRGAASLFVKQARPYGNR